jgi:hydroxymethylbilane synthase
MTLQALRIGTRGSPLALWQAAWVRSRLLERYPQLDVSLVAIKTTGDKILDVPLAQVGGKGLFVKEIEEAMLQGMVDIAVHSMKDVPTSFPPGLGLVCTTKREDPRDALVSRGVPFAELPHGARIGTSALRRQAQLLARRPDLEMVVIRGNVATRLGKLDSEGLDGVVLAAAGLKRLGFADRVSEYLSPQLSLPAIGQGALGIECRLADTAVRGLISFLNDVATEQAVAAERAFLLRCEGGCQVPLAAFGEVAGQQLQLDGLIAAVDGQRVVRGTVCGPADAGHALGVELADRLLADGGRDLLAQVYTRSAS